MRLLFITALTSCTFAPRDLQLQPKSIPDGQGAVMGRVQVFKGDEEVTDSCRVQFRDDKNEVMESVSLAPAGWIFTTLPAQPTRLTGLNCIVWNGLSFYSDQLRFQVKGNGETTYFGHVQIRAVNRDGELLLAGMEGVVSSAGVSASVNGGVPSTPDMMAGGSNAIEVATSEAPTHPHPLTVVNARELAVREYTARYHEAPRSVTALAGGGRVGGTEAARKSQASIRDGVISEQVILPDLTVTWIGSVHADHHWLAVRVMRSTWAPGDPSCGDVVLTVDGKQQRVPAPPRAAGESENATMVKVALPMLEAISHTAKADIEACGLKRRLSIEGALAARDVAEGYDSMLEDLQATAPAQRAPTP